MGPGPRRVRLRHVDAEDYYRNETPVFSVTANEENVLNIYSLDKHRVR